MKNKEKPFVEFKFISYWRNKPKFKFVNYVKIKFNNKYIKNITF